MLQEHGRALVELKVIVGPMGKRWGRNLER
jgi:hypothetical protein